MVARQSGGAKKKRQQQQKKKAGTAPLKKKVLFNDEDDVTAFLEDLDVEVETRCRLIEFEAQRRTDEIMNAFSSELIKLTRNIRSMNAREFCEKHGGDIASVMQKDRQKVLESTGLSGMSNGAVSSPGSVVLHSAKAISQTMSMRKTKGGTLKKVATPNAALQLRARAALGASSTVKVKPTGSAKSGMTPSSTPMRGNLAPAAYATPRDPRLPATPATLMATKAARPLRRGESLMSINGSPIVGGSGAADPFQAKIAVTLNQELDRLVAKDGDGLTVPVSELTNLRQQVAELLTRIQPDSGSTK